MCVPGLVSYYVPLGYSAGLPALFIPDSFVLVPSLTLHTAACSSNHSYTCLGQGYEITNVFMHQACMLL